MSFFFSEVVEVCLGKKRRARERECCNFFFGIIFFNFWSVRVKFEYRVSRGGRLFRFDLEVRKNTMLYGE